MKLNPKKFPRRISLPFGFIISIKQVSINDENLGGCHGMWDAEMQTIYIAKGLAARRKRYILTHELGHAWLDWVHWCLDEDIADN